MMKTIIYTPRELVVNMGQCKDITAAPFAMRVLGAQRHPIGEIDSVAYITKDGLMDAMSRVPAEEFYQWLTTTGPMRARAAGTPLIALMHREGELLLAKFLPNRPAEIRRIDPDQSMVVDECGNVYRIEDRGYAANLRASGAQQSDLIYRTEGKFVSKGLYYPRLLERLLDKFGSKRRQGLLAIQ